MLSTLSLFLHRKCVIHRKLEKTAACTSHLPSFTPPIYPSYIHTAALLAHRHILNILMFHLEQKNFFFSLSFLGVRCLLGEPRLIIYILSLQHILMCTIKGVKTNESCYFIFLCIKNQHFQTKELCTKFSLSQTYLIIWILISNYYIKKYSMSIYVYPCPTCIFQMNFN